MRSTPASPLKKASSRTSILCTPSARLGEAYIRSQQGEGWRLRKTPYNDGGLSGATMERPALKQLRADIKEGLVDVVVVYKVDRLTRSLSDFARMVEIFDGHQVSFVAVTHNSTRRLRWDA